MPVIPGPLAPLPNPPVPGSQQNETYAGLVWATTLENETLGEVFPTALGNASFDSTRSQSGAQSVKITQTGTSTAAIRTFSPGPVWVGRFWFNPDTITLTAAQTLVDISQAQVNIVPQLRMSTAGVLQFGFATGTFQPGPTALLNTWQSIDFRINMGPSVHTIDWMVNGVAQTQAVSPASVVDEVVGRFRVNPTGNNTLNFWYDDFQLSTDSGAYPLVDIPTGAASTSRAVSDTGVTQTDTVATTRLRAVTDTGISETDSVAAAHGFPRAVTDTGVSETDTVATTRVRVIADTGLTETDSVATTRVRAVADTGATQSDTVGLNVRRVISDAGVVSATTVYTDTFTRTVAAGGWGTADSGQAWTVLGTSTASFFSVNGTTGLVTPTTNTTNIVGLDAGGGFDDGDVYIDVSVDILPTTGSTGIGFRTQATNPEQNYYRTRILLPAATGAPTLELASIVGNTATVLASVVSGSSYAAGDTWRIHVRAASTQLRVRAYPSGVAEPSTWDIDVQDSAWQTGGLLIREQIASGTPKPVFSFDNIAVLPTDSVSATVSHGTTRNITDTGATQTDTVATIRVRRVSDTGVSETDTVATTRVRPVTDTGVTESDAIATTRGRAVVDTGVSETDTVATTRARVITTTGVTQTDSVTAAHGYPRAVSDTGISETDTVATTRVRVVSDTGLSETDSVSAAHGPSISVTTTGVTQTDTVSTTRLRVVTDTGVSQTDSTSTLRARFISTTGVTQSDSVAATRGFLRTVSDTGASQSDSTSTLRARFVVTIGVTQTDAVAVAVRRVLGVADTGVAETDTVAAHFGAILHPDRAYVGYVNTTAISGVVSGTGLTGIPAT